MRSESNGLTQAQKAVLKAYQDKISAQFQEAKASLDVMEAKARQKKAQAEITAIAGLQEAKRSIEARIRDLKSTHGANVSRARAEIEADVAKFTSSIDELVAKLKTHAAK